MGDQKRTAMFVTQRGGIMWTPTAKLVVGPSGWTGELDVEPGYQASETLAGAVCWGRTDQAFTIPTDISTCMATTGGCNSGVAAWDASQSGFRVPSGDYTSGREREEITLAEGEWYISCVPTFGGPTTNSDITIQLTFGQGGIVGSAFSTSPSLLLLALLAPLALCFA